MFDSKPTIQRNFLIVSDYGLVRTVCKNQIRKVKSAKQVVALTSDAASKFLSGTNRNICLHGVPDIIYIDLDTRKCLYEHSKNLLSMLENIKSRPEIFARTVCSFISTPSTIEELHQIGFEIRVDSGLVLQEEILPKPFTLEMVSIHVRERMNTTVWR